ncbi:unnamed protein product, partial [Linum tenue]
MDLWKRQHMKKNKEFSTPKAQEINDEMEKRVAEARAKGEEPNHWDIYRQVVGEPRKGRVLGMGLGVTAADVYGYASTDGCSKRCQEDRLKEKEKSDAVIKELQEKIVS